MRASTSVAVLTLALAAAAAPVQDISVRATSSSASTSTAKSGSSVSLSKGLGTAAAGVGLINGSIALWDTIKDKLSSRELEEINNLVARASFSKAAGNVAAGAGIASGLASLYGMVKSAINKREVEGLSTDFDSLSVRELDDLIARASFSKVAGNVAAGAGIASGLASLYGMVKDAINKREVDELTADFDSLSVRELDDLVARASFSKVAGNVAAGTSIAAGLASLYNALTSRELEEELIARGSGSFSKGLNNAAAGTAIASILVPIVKEAWDSYSSSSSNKRELDERTIATALSKALGGLSVAGGLGDFFLNSRDVPSDAANLANHAKEAVHDEWESLLSKFHFSREAQLD